MTEPARARRPRVGWLLACAALLAVTAAAVVVAGRSRGSAAASALPAVAWAPVARTNLTATVPVQGALAYSSDLTLTGELGGVAYTWLPAPGRVLARGARVASVDDQPIFLFYGSVPEWRALAAGVSDGPDVAQLNANLVALGYLHPADLGGDPDAYGWATTLAVERWQAVVRAPVTGVVSLGTVLYAPGPVRVVSLAAHLGAPAQPGAPLLIAGDPTPLVDVPLPVAQESLVRVGEGVSVTMPDGRTTVPGMVATIAPVATVSQGQPSIAVTVRLRDRPRLAVSLDQAPVTVSIVSGTARDALAVPVNALVALAGGGYAVDVRDARGSHAVAVATGLFAGGKVQVQGAITTADEVEVPAQ